MFDFLIFFFCFVGTYVCYTSICWQYQQFWVVSLFLTATKVSRVLMRSSIFTIRKNVSKKLYYVLCQKLNYIWYVDCGVWRVYYEQNTSSMWYNLFKEGRKYFNEDIRPGRPSMSTTNENIEAVRKMSLDNRRITIKSCWWCWHIVRLMSRNFYWCFRHETCGSEVCFKIAKFWAKITSIGHKGHNWWRIMGICL